MNKRKFIMAGDIDEISQALGAIQADVSNVKEHVKDTRDFMAAINLKLGDMNTQHVLMSAKIDAAHLRIDEEKKSRDSEHSLIKAKVDILEQFRTKVIWVVSLLTTACTVILNLVPYILGRIFP